MLKGKAVIELTNVKTGQVERYEDENIVTNALQEYMNALCLLGNIDSQLPIYKNALGGIRLYETALEESVTNVLMPSVGTSKTVGYASYTTKTNADARRGNLNQQETTVLDNGVQLVWDFATSEANGTIACVCLTPKENGEDSYNPVKKSNYCSYTSQRACYNVFGVDEENGWLYCHDGARALKCKFPYNNFGLRRGGVFSSLEIIEVLGEWAFTIPNSSRYNPYRLYDANTIYYIASNSTTLFEYRINLQTGEKTTLTYTIPDASFTSSMRSYRFNGRTIIPHSSNKKIYSVNLENTSDVVLIDTPDLVFYPSDYYGYYVFKLQNGDALLGNTIIAPSADEYDTCFNPLSYSDYAPAVTPCVAVYKGLKIMGASPPKIASGGSANPVMAADIERLMTINNLQQPVTKTADKTMKITYTLLEVDE